MKVTLKDGIANYLEDNYSDFVDDILLADGFEEAFLGVSESYGLKPRACYDSGKCLDVLVERDGMTLEEAMEYFNFNVVGAYVGEYTPAFMFSFDRGHDCISITEEGWEE